MGRKSVIVPSETKGVPLLRLFVDGASRGNPGPAAAGVLIVDAEGTPLIERGFFLGRATSNVAEYRGLLRGLELAAELRVERLEVFADSELIVRQITGQYRVRSPDLIPLFERAQMALVRFDSWQIRHIPRSQNRRADRLANLALNRKADVEDAGDDVAAPATDEEAAGRAGDRPVVQVKVVVGCDPRVCPATMMAGEVVHCDSATPKGLCVYAASAILPAVVGLLNETAVIQTPPAAPIKVTCPRAGCHAEFELALLRPGQ